MKVYSRPEEIPFDEPDYRNYNHERELARERVHEDALKNWLQSNGYAGPRTGEILREPVGDGYACYMLADGPNRVLIHLPYGDAYSSRDVQFLPVKEVLRHIDQGKRLAAHFG